MSRPVVYLSGDAAQRAQHLVAAALEEDIELARLTGEEQHRGGGSLAEVVVVGLVVNATYDVAKQLVLNWVHRDGINPGEVSFSETEKAEQIADVDWDWPMR
jgi:hypothetical protein